MRLNSSKKTKEMAVTRLERKGRRNKNVAKDRVNAMKRLNTLPSIKNVNIEEIKAEFAKKAKPQKEELKVEKVAPEKEVALDKRKIKSKTLGSSTSEIIYIDNITKSDFGSRNIRIKVNNKHLFPAEKPGNLISYPLDFKVGEIDFIAKYKIGSKDGKSRSGILKLEDRIYQEILKIQVGTNLKISKSKENKYIIERL